MNKRILVAALAFASAGAFAQNPNVGSLSSLATPYSQEFDAFPIAPTSGTGQTGYVTQSGNLSADFGSSLSGVFTRRVTGATDRLYVSDGSANTGAFYSAGTAGVSERALGMLGSGSTGQLNSGLRIRNNTGAAITSFYFDFIFEQWRSSTNTTGVEGLTLSYRLVDPNEDDATFAASLNDNTLWTNEKLSTAYFDGSTGTSGGATPVEGYEAGAAGAFIPARVIATTAAALDGNVDANRRKVESYVLLGQNNEANGGTGFQALGVGQDIAIRIFDNDNPGSDSLNSIDSFRAVPEPASMAAMALGLGALAARRRRKSA